jgi:hypothetical protein
MGGHPMARLVDQMKKMGFVEMPGVREYAESMPVLIGDDENGRVVICAFNEGGLNQTNVDVVDFLNWLRKHRPELLTNSLP